MQIRLTVLASRGVQGVAPPCDVLVTAPAGTVLAAVSDALATTAAAAAAAAGGLADPGHETLSVHAGADRLDPQRHVLGEPPLVDGAVLSLYGPSPTAPVPAYGPARARLHVIAGPDAGGVHLLQGGRVSIGRSAEADVALDDPDVSRLHCAVTVTDGGTVTVTDLGSTNGTTVDGTAVDGRPALLRPGAILRIGESAVRFEPSSPDVRPPALGTAPDGEGHLRLPPRGAGAAAGTAGVVDGPDAGVVHEAAGMPAAGALPAPQPGFVPGASAPRASGPPAPPVPPGPEPSGGGHTSPHQEPPHGPQAHGHTPPGPFPGRDATHGAGVARPDAPDAPGAPGSPDAPDTGSPRRRPRGIGAWARRLAAGREDSDAAEGMRDGPADHAAVPDAGHLPGHPAEGPAPGTGDRRRLDPAGVLLTALGPGPRLWERRTDDPEALTVRLGSAHRRGGPGEPVTVSLRDAGSVGLAGPRPRLGALVRSLLAQLAVLHAPSELEIVLLAADPSRSVEDRTEEWGWLGWLPHLQPGHGQDCRLLVAYDRDQAAARTAELTRRLDEAAQGQPAGPGRTVLVVDGDPGSPGLREAVARLAGEGAGAGVHVLALAEAPAATPASPLVATVEAACAASPPLRACGMLALLSGAVATAVRLVDGAAVPGRAAAPGGGLSAADGTVATVDGVSAAWAERFGRALAPLREPEGTVRPADSQSRRAAVALPENCRLLDELGLARATPAAVQARWTGTGRESAGAVGRTGGGAPLVLGAGPRGPVGAVLTAHTPHVFVTGRAGTGKTELLRSVAASLAAGERPDRLALLLVDGAGEARGGLGVCADLPHVDAHLASGDPTRMREFAQSLTAELKRRAGVLDPGGTYGESRRRDPGRPEGRVVAPRPSPDEASLARPGPAGPPAVAGGPRPALRRLVVVVDDFDALVDPALGDMGRPAAGSVVRALEAVARDGARLGMHLVAASGRPDRTDGTAAAAQAAIRAELTARDGDEPVPGRGVVRLADGTETAFQAARVSGRIPRTSTLRPTVVPLDWARSGDPPARRPVRELGNGPTDLALLASAMERAARSLDRSAAREPGGPGRAPGVTTNRSRTVI